MMTNTPAFDSLAALAVGAVLVLGVTPETAHADPASPAAGTSQATPADEAYAALDVVFNESPAPGLDRPAASAWYEQHMLKLYRAAESFNRDYPQDPRRWTAAAMMAESSSILVRMAETRKSRAEKLAAEALVADDINDSDWEVAKGQQISAELGRVRGDEQADLTALRARLDELVARVPEAHSIAMLELQYVDLLKRSKPAQARAWLEQLAASPSERVARLASGQLRVEQIREEPAQMRFTAIDGREVNLAQMRGKVVLINFWATWCGPCVAELPNVQAVYSEYNKRGFEVVGISLDRAGDLKKLEDFVAERKVPWPQFFEEEQERNRFADEYGVTSIPTALLLDQNGKLVHDNARGEALKKEVERLIGS